MFSEFKKTLYFPFAYYFRFFAKIRLSFWQPKTIVITGSSGKTTLLNLVESQVGEKARYSHHANSSYGIPFNILGLTRRTLSLWEWPVLFALAPLKTLGSFPKKKIYVVEADCDRPGEGKFLATLLKPEITLWTNSTKTHSMNFDILIKNGKFKSVEDAIGYEYGYFLEYTSNLVIVNSDSETIRNELSRTAVKKELVKISELTSYSATLEKTEFKTKNHFFKFNFLLPKDFFYSLVMCSKLLTILKIPKDRTFKKFKLPPGRNSVFRGIKNTTIIDSSYNANLDSMTVILEMFDNLDSNNKWVVLGDMLEQGQSEQEEHEKLADIILKMKLKKIILMGPRVSEFTFPKLKNQTDKKIEIEKFSGPKEALDYIKKNINGEELILFKGARFLEGVVENLLLHKSDSINLCRREKVWQERRKKFGL
ncbi:MAG: hypothetical protein HYT08_04260 [Candidatus Levybacteria bacterium]|nr:hypothetical protein [Candidatus Levybacteria bacterium]